MAHIVVTAGAAGAYAGSSDGIFYCPALPADIHGTAGAGDAFATTFAALITLGHPVERALRSATVNAASVVGFADTQSGLLDLDRLDRRTAETREDIALRHWSL